MIVKYRNYLIGFVVLIALLLTSYIVGCQRGKKLVNPNIVTHTVILHDTTTHHIIDKVPYYIIKHDSIEVTDTFFTKVDTTVILKDYFSKHYYTRNWEDSLISVTMKDVISENKPIDNTFSYKILRDQVITTTNVDNSVHYQKYFTLGLDVPIKNVNYIELEGIYVWQKGYIGVGYSPQLKSFDIKLGGVLFKFK
jgi:hypothetical protein